MGLGSKIKALRERRDWSQAFLADKAGVGRQTLHIIEQRDSARSVHFPAIARALGVTVDELAHLSVDELVVASTYQSPNPPASALATNEPAPELHLYATPADRQNTLLRLFDQLTAPQQAQYLAELQTQVQANRAIAAHYQGRSVRSVENERIEKTYGVPKK